jgi:hypothetical protein
MHTSRATVGWSPKFLPRAIVYDGIVSFDPIMPRERTCALRLHARVYFTMGPVKKRSKRDLSWWVCFSSPLSATIELQRYGVGGIGVRTLKWNLQ